MFNGNNSPMNKIINFLEEKYMNYDTEALTKLAALKALAGDAEKKFATKTSVETLSGRVDGLVAAGGEPNVITKVKVNGTEVPITDKAANVSVPTKVSQLTNDKGYQTSTQVETTVQQKISASGHARYEKVDRVPTAQEAQGNVLYLVMNTVTGHYDIYAKIGTTVERIDDTTVDLSAYSTTTEIENLLKNKVDKVAGKGLSTNDYTTEEKDKLEGLRNYTHPSHTAKASGLYKVTVDNLGHVTAAAAVAKADITKLGIPAQDTTYGLATASTKGLMSAEDKSKLDSFKVATDAEVAAMLAEVFGA